MQWTPSRRHFLSTLWSVGTASLVGARYSFAQEAPPETTRLRLIKGRSICWAPQYIAEELLRMEGFTEISYVDDPAGVVSKLLAAGQADLSMNFVRSEERRVGKSVDLV